MWEALLNDLAAGAPVALIAARFHKGLAAAIADMVQHLARRCADQGLVFRSVAFSGGCFQNKLLLEEVTQGLEDQGFECFSHSEVPANDGGLALGQAVIAARRHMNVSV